MRRPEGTSGDHRSAPGGLPAGVVGLLTIKQAAAYLRLSPRHLQDRADIPRVNVSAPGAGKPAWRYRVEDLEQFAASRNVNPYVSVSAA